MRASGRLTGRDRRRFVLGLPLMDDGDERSPTGNRALRSEGFRFPHFFPQTVTFRQFSPSYLGPYGHTWIQRKEEGQPQKPSSSMV